MSLNNLVYSFGFFPKRSVEVGPTYITSQHKSANFEYFQLELIFFMLP